MVAIDGQHDYHNVDKAQCSLAFFFFLNAILFTRQTLTLLKIVILYLHLHLHCTCYLHYLYLHYLYMH